MPVSPRDARTLIHRVRDRSTFVALRREGRRARQGPVTVTFLADDIPTDPDRGTAGVPPRVAYGVGTRVGPAVVRNRVKRRLRAIVRDLAVSTGGLAPGSGAYLVSIGPDAVSLSYAELASCVDRALQALTPAPTPLPVSS